MQGAPYDAVAAEEWFPTEGLERNAQPKGGFASLVDDAARQLSIRRSAPVRARGLERSRRHRDPAGRRDDRGRSRGDRRAARPAARRACRRSIRCRRWSSRRRSAGSATAPASWARSICASRTASGPSSRNGSAACPTAPDRRGTFNTWVSHVEETGLPILLSFANGATAARLDRSASDEEVKEVAMSSLRKMFGDDIPAGSHALSALAVRSRGRAAAIPIRRSAARPRIATTTPGRSAGACSSPARRPSRSSTERCMPRCGRPNRLPRRCSGRPPASTPHATCARGPGAARRGAAQWLIGLEDEWPREQDPLRPGDHLGPGDARRAVRRADQHGARPNDSLERARGSNKLMWWRVRLQL